MDRMRRFMHEFVVLGDHCLGREAFTAFVQKQLVCTASDHHLLGLVVGVMVARGLLLLQRELNSDVNQMMMSWMNSTVIGHLDTVRSSITFTSRDVMQYVVRRSSPRPPRAASAQQPQQETVEQTPVVAMDTSEQGRSSSDEAFESAEEAEEPATASRRDDAQRHVSAQQTHSAVTQACKPRSRTPKMAASAQEVDSNRSPQDVQFPLRTPVS